jgi:hypothetical protein
MRMYCVLKKGGYILCSVPFIYAFHSSTGTHQDFTRFTQFGLQELFSSFEKIETEQEEVSILVISILSEYSALLITNRDILYWRLQWLFAWMLFPLRLLDLLLAKKSKPHRIAPGFYFIDKK